MVAYIHLIFIVISLGGFTRGARNDIFACRPAPIQIALMGYPGSMGAGESFERRV